MTLSEVCALTALTVPLLITGAVEVWKFEAHLPKFELLQARVLYADCLRTCEENALRTCKLNGILPEECNYDCTHCQKFIVKE